MVFLVTFKAEMIGWSETHKTQTDGSIYIPYGWIIHHLLLYIIKSLMIDGIRCVSAGKRPLLHNATRPFTRKTKMHQSIQVGFPVFSLEFTPNKPRLLVGGGGGPNKSGIKNAILYLSVNERAVDADKITELKLSNEEDGCMSITIHPKTKTFVAGISESKSQQDQGINNNCRIFRVANEQ